MSARVSLCGVARGDARGLEEWIAAAADHVAEIGLVDGGCGAGRLRDIAGSHPKVRLHEPAPPLRPHGHSAFQRLASNPILLLLDCHHRVLPSFWRRLPALVGILESGTYEAVRMPLITTTLTTVAAVEELVAAPKADGTELRENSICALVRWDALGKRSFGLSVFDAGEPVFVLDESDGPAPRIGVSLLVHESPDVIEDQIQNIRTFLPGASIVLHVNLEFFESGRFDSDRLERIPGVFVNPEHLRTGWATTFLTLAIVSNFTHLSRAADFDYFLLDSSNDLYVRRGAELEIRRHQAGCRLDPLPVNGSPQSASARNDRGLASLSEHLGGAAMYVSGHEGAYFQKDLFAEMAPLVDRFAREDVREWTRFGDPEGDYGKEEYYFSTAAGALAGSIGPPIVYRDFAAQPSIAVEDIERVVEGRWSELPLQQGEGFFGVKRIARVYDDPARVFVRSLTEHAMRAGAS